MQKIKLAVTFLIILFCNAVFSQVPYITDVGPIYGTAGSSVTVYGFDFGPTPSNNIVRFGAVKANVISSTPNSIEVLLPHGLTHQPVSVTNSAGLTGHYRIVYPKIFSPNGNSINFISSSFTIKTDFTTAGTPKSMAIGDFNNDGKPDVAVTNSASNSVSVFANISDSNGAINFAVKIDFTTGSNPDGIAIADFDGDGKLDIAVANTTSSTVSILRNTATSATISFATKVDITSMLQAGKIAIGDFDNDGKPDIAATSNGNNNIRLIRNTSTIGVISFAAPVTLTLSSPAADIVAADIHDDRKPEIAVVCSSINTLSLFKNNSVSGSFTFDPKVDFATGNNPKSVSAYTMSPNELNGFLVSNTSSNTVSLFQSSFVSLNTGVQYPTGNSPVASTVFDLNGDRQPDIISACQTNSALSIIRNDSSHGFLPKQDYTTAATPVAVMVVDLNADERPDMLSLSSVSNALSVHRSLVGSTSPVVTGFSPVKAAAGEPVVITGKNFLNVNSVLVGTTPAASFTINNDSTITAITAQGSSGSIRLYSPNNWGLKPGFTFTFPPYPAKIINTIGGNGTSGFSGDSVPALNTALGNISSAFIDTTGGGFLYINENNNHRIRKINLVTGIITTVAGNGTPGITGDGGLATNAQIYAEGGGICMDSSRNIYFAERGGPGRIRKVDAVTGIITTIAGGGTSQESSGIPGTSAALSLPSGICMDKDSGILYINDFNKIRKVVLSTGLIYTIYGRSDSLASETDSIPAVNALFNRLGGLTMDKNKNLYVSDNKWLLPDLIAARIRKIDRTTGIITTVAGNGNIGTDGDGGIAKSSQVGYCWSLIFDTSGRFLYITQSAGDGDYTKHRIRMIDMETGIISTIAGKLIYGYSGDGGNALDALLTSPQGVCVDKNNRIYFGDNFKYIRRLAPLNTNQVLCPVTNTSFTSEITGNTYQWQMAINDTAAFVNAVNSAQLSGVNSQTLLLNNIPSSWYGYRFRCVINGTNPGQQYQLKFESSWTGSVSSAWETPANWSCGLIPDINTDVIIPAGANVTVNSNSFCRTLKLEPGATLTIMPGYTLTIAQ